MKTKLLLFSLLIIQFAVAQNITFPDANFKSKLVNFDSQYPISRNLAGVSSPIDVNNDNQISPSEALNVSVLNIVGDNITSLQGLEFFTNLEILYVNTDFVENINLSTLVNLERLYVGTIFFSQSSPGTIGLLSNLDVSNNINLDYLFIQTGSLELLDLTSNINLEELVVSQETDDFELNVSNLANLRTISHSSAFTANLDLSTCTNLLNLYIFGSGFSSIDVSNQPILSVLQVSNTNVTSLDLSNNFSLEVVYAGNNQLTNLNLGAINYVSSLEVPNNNLTTLNTNNLPYLEFLNCSNNQLTELFIKNTSIESSLMLGNNPNLDYVCCDSAQVIPVQNVLNQSGQYNITVNSNCLVGDSLATNEFENNSRMSLFPNPASTFISFNSNSKIDRIEIYDVNGRKVIETSNSSVPIENIQKGIYFAKVYSQNDSQIFKFIKD